MITILALLAVLIGLAGWLWIVVMAFSEGDTLWGVGGLIFPLIALIYGAINFQELKVPVILMRTGMVIRIALAVLIAAT
ncbi:MAG: hypothetical protein U0892_14500 [Pirellulales bacterium]